MAARRKKSRRIAGEQWETIVADFLESGMTRPEFAAARGLNYKTLCSKLRAAGHPGPSHQQRALEGAASGRTRGAEDARAWVEAVPAAAPYARNARVSAVRVTLGEAAFEMAGDLSVADFVGVCRELSCLR